MSDAVAVRVAGAGPTAPSSVPATSIPRLAGACVLIDVSQPAESPGGRVADAVGKRTAVSACQNPGTRWWPRAHPGMRAPGSGGNWTAGGAAATMR